MLKILVAYTLTSVLLYVIVSSLKDKDTRLKYLGILKVLLIGGTLGFFALCTFVFLF